MPKVTFVQLDGSEQLIEADIDQSLMQAALAWDIPGILAECGGSCACATCHVLIDPDWISRIPPKSDDEEMILQGALNVTGMSRLSCQIEVTSDLDGLRVTVPEAQL